jgi:hypothetical protein
MNRPIRGYPCSVKIHPYFSQIMLGKPFKISIGCICNLQPIKNANKRKKKDAHIYYKSKHILIKIKAITSHLIFYNYIGKPLQLSK